MTSLTQTPRVLVGSFLVVIGSVLLLDQLRLLPGDIHFFSLWPWIFVLLSVHALTRRDWLNAVVTAAVAAVFLAPRFVPSLELEEVLQHWPLFLVGLGVLLVLRGVLGEGRAPARRETRSEGLAVFRNLNLAPTSPSYQGDSLAVFIGQVKLDLTEAQLDPKGATIEIYCMWGGVEIRVPQDWSVELRLQPFMGGAEDKTRAPGPIEGYEPRLVITGIAWMAGVEVLN